jgi:hypothetical protein
MPGLSLPSGPGAFSLLRPKPIAVANDGFGRMQGTEGELLCRAMFQRPRSQYPAPLARLRPSGNGGLKCWALVEGHADLLVLAPDNATGNARAEDDRTGLTCPVRQAKMAGQCLARCRRFVALLGDCSDAGLVWQNTFGDIGGTQYGFARVDLCGPRLKNSPGIIRQR